MKEEYIDEKPAIRRMTLKAIREIKPIKRYFVVRFAADSSGVYICKSIVNDLRHGNFICNSEGIYLTYEHRIEIPVEFTYVNQ